MEMKVASILLGLALLLCATPAISDPLTFRGLGASSKKENVLKVFPQARSKNSYSCSQGETIERSPEGETMCETLEVDSYLLDNIEFDLGFKFNVDGTLRYVSLWKKYGTYGTDEGKVPASTINSAFMSLADLLTSKYGPSAIDLFRMRPTNEIDKKSEWQPGRGTTMQFGGDRISLSSSGVESRTAPGLFVGTVQIFYTFAKRDEFDKF